MRTVFTIFAEQLQFQNIIKFKGKVNLNNKIAKTKGMKVDMINDIKFRHWQDEEAG